MGDVQIDRNLAVSPDSGPFLAWGSSSGQDTATAISREPGKLEPVKVRDCPWDDRSKTTDRPLLASCPFPLCVKSAQPFIPYPTPLAKLAEDRATAHSRHGFGGNAKIKSIMSTLTKKRRNGHHVTKLGPLMYRGSQKTAKQLVKISLQHRLHENSVTPSQMYDSSLYAMAKNHRQYKHLVHAFPFVVRLIPESIQDGLASKEGLTVLQIGASVAKKWASSST